MVSLSLIQTVEEVLNKHRCLDQKVIVACSGGADSTALAHICGNLCERGVLKQVVLVYIDHGLRDDSAKDGDTVVALAKQLNVGSVVEKASVNREQASLEAAARDARYEGLHQVAMRIDASFVLLAHTQNDQVETVLMRILRGTGVAGLAGIPEARDIYVRPLLSITRKVIIDYLNDHHVSWIDDPMNEDKALTRVRVRQDMLKWLRTENPAIDQALLRLSLSAQEHNDVLAYTHDMLANTADQEPMHESQNGQGDPLKPIQIKLIQQAPAAVAKTMLVHAATKAGIGPLGFVHVNALYDLAMSEPHGSKALSLPQGRAIREYDRLRFDFEHQIKSSNPHVNVRYDGSYNIRIPHQGDRMKPLRLKGKFKKLSDLFIDAKVPRALRKQAIVVVCDASKEILWVEHLGSAYGIDVNVTLTDVKELSSNRVL